MVGDGEAVLLEASNVGVGGVGGGEIDGEQEQNWRKGGKERQKTIGFVGEFDKRILYAHISGKIVSCAKPQRKRLFPMLVCVVFLLIAGFSPHDKNIVESSFLGFRGHG